MALSVCVVPAIAAKACARAPPDQPGTATGNELSAEFGHCLRDLVRSAAAAQYASASLAAVEEITLLRGDFCAAIILADAHMVTSSGSTKGVPMIVSSRIRRTIAIATTVIAMGAGSAAATSSSASAATTYAQHAASPSATRSPRVWVAECQGQVYPPTETKSGSHKYVDFDTWVECIAVGVGIDEIQSWIRLEFDFRGPSGYAQWVPVTAWREKNFPGASETKFWNNQSWLCEGAYDGQFRVQAYAKATLSNGAVLRFPEVSGYATGDQVGIDC